MSNDDPGFLQTNNLLLQKKLQKNKQLFLLISKDLKIIDVSPGIKKLFNKSADVNLNHAIIYKLFRVNNINELNLKNNSLFELIINEKVYDVFVSELSSYYIISFSIKNNLFNLLKLYVSSIINHLPGAVYWKDLEGKYLGCNKFVANMAGYDNPDDMIGKTDYDLCWKDFADEWRLLDKKVINDDKTLVREEKVKLASGKIITEITFKTPLKDENNTTIGIIGTSLDITELKDTQARLKKAKELADAANRAKTEFIANMSHDIRTPLSGVVGLGEIVERELKDSVLKSKVHDMVRSSEELLKMLNEILDVVSMEDISGQSVELSAFDLSELLGSIVDLEKSSVDLKNIEILYNIDPKIPRILIGDYKKLHHILLNLVGNSIKFTFSGKVVIEVKLIEELGGAVKVLFSVTDTGIGIPKDSLNKIFELFYKITPSYKGLSKGHGIGLHIAKKYTELLGGKLEVLSTENSGSKFYFSLLLEVGAQGLDVCNKINERFELLPKEVLKPSKILNILIIEDNDIARDVLKQQIEELSFKVIAACDGESGFEIFKSQNIDFIITDIGLPGISGVEFAKQVREYEKHFSKLRVPIVALTGHAVGKIGDECLQSGIDKVILKPISREDIKELIYKYSGEPDLGQSSKVVTSNASLDIPENVDDLFSIEDEMIFDIESAKKILGENNTKLLMSLVKDTINRDIPNELQKLKLAHSSSDWQGISDICHKLKGGFLSISLSRAATACKYLERYHKTGKTELLEKLYAQVLSTLDVTVNKLRPFF